MIKKIFFCVFTLSFFCSSQAQYRNKKYDKAFISFMNYIRDSVLKIDTWADSEFMGLGKFQGYTPPNFEETFKEECNSFLSKEERVFVLEKLKDTSAYKININLLQCAQRREIDTVSKLFHKLYVLRSELSRYVFNDFLLKSYPSENEVDIDSLKLISSNFQKVVKNLTHDYNVTVRGIRAFKKKQMYWYGFKAPIFLKRNRCCVFEYCDYKNFKFYIILFKKISGEWSRLKTISTFSEIIQI